MPPESRTRLERHRESFALSGGIGELLRVEDLTPDELTIVNRTFFERIREIAAEDLQGIYAAYLLTLHEWGVMCPHPRELRRYDGWRRSDVPVPSTESRWYECGLCQAAVINR
jgi:hypothetical protein